jgi:hypothetical protein
MPGRFAFSCVGLMGLALATPAEAAVRQCRDALAAASVGQASEALAKRAALTLWTSRAAGLGPAFANWRIADSRVLKCTPSPKQATTFDCVAVAKPCTIIQNPESPNRGGRSAPKKRLRAKGAPIET